MPPSTGDDTWSGLSRSTSEMGEAETGAAAEQHSLQTLHLPDASLGFASGVTGFVEAC